MTQLERRLWRLERRLRPVAAARLLARLEAARLRCGLPPISPERETESRKMSLIEILHAGRERARLRPDPKVS